jgi:hypothetical protein
MDLQKAIIFWFSSKKLKSVFAHFWICRLDGLDAKAVYDARDMEIDADTSP